MCIRDRLETVYAAIRFAKAHGIKVLLNPAPASRDLSLDMACQCDFFVPNETELDVYKRQIKTLRCMFTTI